MLYFVKKWGASSIDCHFAIIYSTYTKTGKKNYNNIQEKLKFKLCSFEKILIFTKLHREKWFFASNEIH